MNEIFSTEERSPIMQAQEDQKDRINVAVSEYYRGEKHEALSHVVRRVFLDEIIEWGTDPRVHISEAELSALSELQEKGFSTTTRPLFPGLLFMIAQSFRMNPDDTDALTQELFPQYTM